MKEWLKPQSWWRRALSFVASAKTRKMPIHREILSIGLLNFRKKSCLISLSSIAILKQLNLPKKPEINDEMPNFGANEVVLPRCIMSLSDINSTMAAAFLSLLPGLVSYRALLLLTHAERSQKWSLPFWRDVKFECMFLDEEICCFLWSWIWQYWVEHFF